ncbi:MAG: signal peptidase I, partial [Oscillospiraceae bacterium]
GSSMQPQFKTGDYVIAYGLFYQPRQGDVVIIDDNNSLGEPLIKRVIATEGETVDVDRVTGAVMVDGEPFPDVVSAGSDNLRGDVKYPCIVPKGCIFVMGDNRSVSLDSRFGALGFVDTRSVVGKEVLVFGK